MISQFHRATLLNATHYVKCPQISQDLHFWKLSIFHKLKPLSLCQNYECSRSYLSKGWPPLDPSGPSAVWDVLISSIDSETIFTQNKFNWMCEVTVWYDLISQRDITSLSHFVISAPIWPSWPHYFTWNRPFEGTSKRRRYRNWRSIKTSTMRRSQGKIFFNDLFLKSIGWVKCRFRVKFSDLVNTILLIWEKNCIQLSTNKRNHSHIFPTAFGLTSGVPTQGSTDSPPMSRY